MHVGKGDVTGSSMSFLELEVKVVITVTQQHSLYTYTFPTYTLFWRHAPPHLLTCPTPATTASQYPLQPLYTPLHPPPPYPQHPQPALLQVFPAAIAGT